MPNQKLLRSLLGVSSVSTHQFVTASPSRLSRSMRATA